MTNCTSGVAKLSTPGAKIFCASTNNNWTSNMSTPKTIRVVLEYHRPAIFTKALSQCGQPNYNTISNDHKQNNLYIKLL